MYGGDVALVLAAGEFFLDFRDVTEAALARGPAETEPGLDGGTIECREQTQLPGVVDAGGSGAAGSRCGCVLHTFIMNGRCDRVALSSGDTSASACRGSPRADGRRVHRLVLSTPIVPGAFEHQIRGLDDDRS